MEGVDRVAAAVGGDPFDRVIGVPQSAGDEIHAPLGEVRAGPFAGGHLEAPIRVVRDTEAFRAGVVAVHGYDGS